MKKARHYRGGYQLAGSTGLARELRAQPTPAENLLWQLLRDRQLQGFKFRRQHQIGSYVADFYCRKACLVVECDGSVHNANEQWQHDQVRDAYMVSQGLRVLRFSNDQILNDTENFCGRLQSTWSHWMKKPLTKQEIVLVVPVAKPRDPDVNSFV